MCTPTQPDNSMRIRDLLDIAVEQSYSTQSAMLDDIAHAQQHCSATMRSVTMARDKVQRLIEFILDSRTASLIDKEEILKRLR